MLDIAFRWLSELTGTSEDQIKLIVLLLLGFPVASLFARIPRTRPNIRHNFNITLSVYVLLGFFKIYSAFYHLLASITATYCITRWYKSPHMPWLVLGLNLSHLTYNHSIRYFQSQSYETVEVTGPQMILVMKLTTFAWNVYDGRRKEVTDPWQNAKKVTKFPNILEYLGYCFYFPGLIVGPYLDYAGYIEVVTGSLYEKPSVKTTIPPGQQFPAGRRKAALYKLALGIAFLATFVLLSNDYKYEAVLEDSFLAKPMWKRILLLQVIGPVTRAKYYAVWSLTEGAHILSGWGFSEPTLASTMTSSTAVLHTPPNTWTAAMNVHLPSVEIPSNSKLVLDAWNIRTNIWLRECVYKRVGDRSKKSGDFIRATATFSTSALWHGIAPGYYLTFLMGGFITLGTRLGRRHLRPYFLNNAIAKRIYDIVTTLITLSLLNYYMCSFQLLTAKDALGGWQRVRWYGHVVLLGGVLCLLGIQRVQKIRQKID